jgi:tetratricopeptide (TPR) repeat protein
VLPRGDRLTLGEFLPQAERRALQRLEGQPELEAHLRLVLGRVAHARGRFAEAQAHLEQALDVLRRFRGSEDAETLDAALALGATLLELRRQDAARPILQDAYDRLAWRRDERAAEAALLLANAVGVRPEAERLLRESLDVRLAATPPDDLAVSRSLVNLGNFLVLADRTSEGIPLLEAALARLDTPALRATPLLLTALNDLGQARVRREELAEAERLQRRMLEAAPSIVEPESLPVANALNNLGGVLAAQGRHAEAERVLRESFALHERLFGVPHVRTANVARNLGITVGLRHRHAEAHEWLDRAVGLMSLAGAKPPATAWMRAQRATTASRLGRLDEALRGTEQAIADIGQAETPQLATHLAECRLLFGGLLLQAGRPAEAMVPLEAALAHFSTAAPVSKSKVAWVNVDIGRALAALRRCDEARARLASLDVYAAWGLAAPDRVADARRALAQCAGVEPPAVSASVAPAGSRH